jgi:hypothetical protein
LALQAVGEVIGLIVYACVLVCERAARGEVIVDSVPKASVVSGILRVKLLERLSHLGVLRRPKLVL